MLKKSIIVVYSYHHNNTRKIADAMANVLSCNVKSPVEVDCEELPGYDPECTASPVTEETARMVIGKIKSARRPVLYAGSAVRYSGSYDIFLRMAEALGAPVVTCWNSIDLLWDEHPLYTGRGGMMGDRAGKLDRAGIKNRHFIFTDETASDVSSVIAAYREGRLPPAGFRRIK